MSRFNIILLIGQSLASGVGGMPPLPYTKSSNFWMLGDNIGSSSLREGNYPIDAGAVIQSYQEPLQESVCSGFANYMIKNHPNEQFGFVYAGVGGQALSVMDKGTAPYTKSIEQVRRMASFAKSSGLTPLLNVIMINEENDTAGYTADWKPRLSRYSNDINIDHKSVTGQLEPVRILTSQTSSHGFYHLYGSKSGLFSCAPTPTASIDKANICNERPDRWVMVSAKYQYPYDNDYSVHLNNEGYRSHGEKIGQVFSRTILMGDLWKPLQLKSAAMKTPDTIVATFDVPAPPLLWDETITNPGSRGFSLLSGKGIVKVDIVGSSQVELLVAGTISEGDRLQYAWDNWVDSGNYNGNNLPFKLCGKDGGSPRGQLQDSDAISGSAYNQANHCIHCSVPIFTLNTLDPGNVESRTINRGLQNIVVAENQDQRK